MSLDTHQSVYRERLLEHVLIAELLKHSWLEHSAEMEVSKPEVDRAGYDVILEARGIVRHVQLKSSTLAAKTARQKVHFDLASKPSGCIVWSRFEEKTLSLSPFYFFGSGPGRPLPCLNELPIAKHTKGNSVGVKALRPNIRVISQGKFEVLESIADLYDKLFVEGSSHNRN